MIVFMKLGLVTCKTMEAYDVEITCLFLGLVVFRGGSVVLSCGLVVFSGWLLVFSGGLSVISGLLVVFSGRPFCLKRLP